jgi:hypothetical protein
MADIVSNGASFTVGSSEMSAPLSGAMQTLGLAALRRSSARRFEAQLR